MPEFDNQKKVNFRKIEIRCIIYLPNKAPQSQKLISVKVFGKRVQGGFFRKSDNRACNII